MLNLVRLQGQSVVIETPTGAFHILVKEANQAADHIVLTMNAEWMPGHVDAKPTGRRLHRAAGFCWARRDPLPEMGQEEGTWPGYVWYRCAGTGHQQAGSHPIATTERSPVVRLGRRLGETHV